MAAEQNIVTASGGLNGAQTAAGGVSSLVETRLVYDRFDSHQGRFEGRDAAGSALFCADIDQMLAAIPCFTAETLVATGAGLVPVGSLTPGMRVITRDNGMQELRWVGIRRFGWQELGLNPLLRPVRIAAGALGDGLPERDMIVSPNHHFLTRKQGAGEGSERLTMARDLLGRDGVTQEHATGVDYWQILFDKHQLVLSDGCWSESFLPTPDRLAALDGDGRDGLTRVMPELAAQALPGFDPVRPFAGVGSAA
ncbi:hypothetical protein CKO11_10730 [Rhodobacter sp. TJ_12]|uniref:Hint domain-containing protein n=1 Tax=Rhodobacter sp. TJ_12 TaxID=2029399 RepID=UPI001CBAEC84|nr:Hint domain-containing protein [Rhodobacter sp. TJ_12]MBZ4022934.1 hypothetical protein [Rhodobacter sp. TJ_12]